jgi:hypothetical protein
MSPKKTRAKANQAESPASDADARAEAEHQAWLDRYLPVEQAVMADRERRRERRLALRAKRREERAREFGDICEASDGMASRWHAGGFFFAEEFVRTLLRDGGYLAYLDWARRYSSGRVDALRGAMRRPLYYARENERRRALAAERRRIRQRTTENPCPTKEQILDAWLRVKESHEATIRFGGLIEDLECYLDNSLIRDGDGAIVGRCPGVKGWLKDNLPALWLRYTTVMRYKAAAKKLRQVVGLSDPTPVDRVLAPEPSGGGAPAPGERAGGDRGAEGRAAGGAEAAAGGTAAGGGAGPAAPDVAVVRARALWLEVAAGAGGSPTSLVARIDALVDPERVEDANMLREWRERYENEITVRTRRKWWRRLLKKAAGGALVKRAVGAMAG